ncbi:MAG: DUF4422 domain-containing protein [Alistipes sp.]|nr:DUF4422 domain-containing protein [Alistipes sp.]
MYWAWKNLKDTDIIGLCHYRRYFDFHGLCRKCVPFDEFPTSDFANIDISVPDKIIGSLHSGQAIIAEPFYYKYNLATIYSICHISEDLRTMQEVIRETQPEKFIRAFDVVMYHNNAISNYNMFIMTWGDFDKYCRWLFPLLAEIENRTDISNYNPTQRRIFGYMAERLFNVYLYAEKFSKIYKPVIKITEKPKNLSRHIFIRNRLRGHIITALARSHSWI